MNYLLGAENLTFPSFLLRKFAFAVLKNLRLNSTHYFIMKITNKREFQQIVFNHSSDIDFRSFMNLYKKCTAKPYSFLVIDTTLASDNSLGFRKNLLRRILEINHDNC